MAVESLEILRPLTPIFFFFALLGSLENDPLSSACLLSQIQVDQEITVRFCVTPLGLSILVPMTFPVE